jgi:hypothetical protein
MKTDNAKPRLAQVIGRATVSRLAASRSPSPPSRTSPPVRLATPREPIRIGDRTFSKQKANLRPWRGQPESEPATRRKPS